MESLNNFPHLWYLGEKWNQENVTSNQWEKQKDFIVYNCNNKHFRGDFVKMKHNDSKHFNWVYLILVLIHLVTQIFLYFSYTWQLICPNSYSPFCNFPSFLSLLSFAFF